MEPHKDKDINNKQDSTVDPSRDTDQVEQNTNSGTDSKGPTTPSGEYQVRDTDTEDQTTSEDSPYTPPNDEPTEVNTEGEFSDTRVTQPSESHTEDEDNTDNEVMTEEEEILQDYFSLADLPNPPRRIPRQHVKDFVSTIERVSKTFLKKKDLRSLFDITRLLKTVFDPYLTKRKTALIRRALREYPQVELPNPRAEGRKRYTPQDEGPEGKIRRAESYFQDGFLRKAMQSLLSTKKPIPVTTEVYLQMQKLFPEHDLKEGKVNYTGTPKKPDEDDILKEGKRINLEASGGPSGWNNRHLKVAMRSPSFVKFLTVYSGMMAVGTAPGRDIMRVSEGIALAEPNDADPEKIRPISMGEVIFKLCALTSCRKNRKPGDLMSTQYGNGTMGGAEPLIKLKKEFLLDETKHSESVIDADRKNGYGTKKIADVREGLSTWNPENGPLFEWCYGSPTVIMVRSSTGHKLKLWVRCLRQGDPNAGYFYQSGDRKKLEELADQLGPTSVVTSYFDDVTVFNKKKIHEEETPASNPEDWETPMETILNILPNINANKTKRVTPQTVQTEGYETLGGFIGNRDSRTKHLKEKLQEFRHAVHQLDPLQKQTQLVLLRQCIVPRLNHTMRNVDPLGCEGIYQEIKRVIVHKVSQLSESQVRLGRRDTRVGYMPLTGQRTTTSDLVSLPVRYGGLGLSDPQAQSNIAWKSSQEKNKWIIDKWFRSTGNRPPPKPQKHRMEDYWRQASNDLLTRVYRPAALRISANAEKSASAWLSTIPTTKDLQLSNDEVKKGLQSRLLQRDDKIHTTKRGKIIQTIVNEFKAAEYEAIRISQDTTYKTPEDPRTTWVSDSVVEPMAITVTTYNVPATTTPNPPKDTKSLLKYYQKKIHEAAKKLQQQRVRSRHYDGYTHFPMMISPTGALLGNTRKWMKELKQRATLNKTPSAIIQLVSVQSIKSLR